MASLEDQVDGRLRSQSRFEALMPRCIGTIGGTTTAGDIAVALSYLASPQRVIHGPTVAEYEASFARTVGVDHAVSFWAGRLGLYAILRALGVGPGDEVLLQVPTHIVVANAIRYVGARPVYVDCDLDTYNIDLEQAERRITPKTRVLILQHTFGNPVDIDRALALASEKGIEVIEDCVHALGATYRGRPVGSFARAAFFSTEETKTISSTMGGVAVTKDPELAASLRAFQSRCSPPDAGQTIRYLVKFVMYHVLTEPHLHRLTRALYELAGKRHPLPGATSNQELVGLQPANYNQLLSNAQAALALRQLRRLGSNVEHRRVVAAAYERWLKEHGFRVPSVAAGAEPAFVRYPVWANDRSALIRAAYPGILVGNWFTSVLEEAISPDHGGYEKGSCPRAEAAAEHLVNLPTHPRVTSRDVRAVEAALASVGY